MNSDIESVESSQSMDVTNDGEDEGDTRSEISSKVCY